MASKSEDSGKPKPAKKKDPESKHALALVDYIQALEEGEVKVAYARVMLVGPGGVGKSSLLNGLMNLPMTIEGFSTQIADTMTVIAKDRPSASYWAKSGKYWVPVSEKDEMSELFQSVRNFKAHTEQQSFLQKEGHDQVTDSDAKFFNKYVKPIVDQIGSLSKEVILPTDTEVYLNVWDCGGQPIFLNLLPAFLTARTLFLLMFDARFGLSERCHHLSHCKGKKPIEELEDFTTLELMVRWMSTIHATLLEKRSRDNQNNFPKILPVGTHGDYPSVKRNKDVFSHLSAACVNKAFSDLLLDGVIVDNTTAGKGEKEDPSFQIIRQAADSFATTDVAIRTPIKWVLFRKVFKKYAKENKKPVISRESVKDLAKTCLIPQDSVDSMLSFYHDLAVFFHYSSIPSLKSSVIVDPQWLIQQMAKILALRGFEMVKNEHLWYLLQERGILVERLYQKVLSSQKELSPQGIIDILEHFLIIASIDTKKLIHQISGREYFVPSMLPGRPVMKTSGSATSNMPSAVPLHLLFSTRYLPPGFFTRLLTVMSKHTKCKVDFSSKIYRNEVQFLYGNAGQQLDKVIISENKYSISIHVERVASRPYKCSTFIQSCHDIFENLHDSIPEIKKWLPGIDVSFGLECDVCPEKDHFVVLPPPSSVVSGSYPVIWCQNSKPVKLTVDQKFWYSIHKDHSTKAEIHSYEISAVAREVIVAGKTVALAETLEMSEHLEDLQGDVKTLLERWQKEMSSMSIPARPSLMHHLASIGMQNLQRKLLNEEFSPEEHVESLKEIELKRELERYKSLCTSVKEENEELNKSLISLNGDNEELKRNLESLKSHQICGGKDQELAAVPPGPKRQWLTSKLPHSVIMSAEPKRQRPLSELPHSISTFSNKVLLESIDDTQLDIDDLADVLEAVEPLSGKWRMLCIKLGIRNSDLGLIEHNHHGDAHTCLFEALEVWLKLNYNHSKYGRPSWQRLAKSVSSLDYGLFERIAKMHTLK